MANVMSYFTALNGLVNIYNIPVPSNIHWCKTVCFVFVVASL